MISPKKSVQKFVQQIAAPPQQDCRTSISNDERGSKITLKKENQSQVEAKLDEKNQECRSCYNNITNTQVLKPNL
jgi:tRNA U54 and U55 pseudouridine synthase Pus10